MNIPGFTAEASLYRKSEVSRCAVNQTGRTGEQAIIPQLFWGWGSVMGALDCEFVCQPDWYGAGVNCFWHCPRDPILFVDYNQGML
jgi:hypothetical protein